MQEAHTGLLAVILTQALYLLVFSTSTFYLICHAKAVYLLRNFCSLDSIYRQQRQEFGDSQSERAPVRLSDLLNRERNSWQMQRDEVTARKL